MTGTEFEKAAGREKAKKWKASVRVAPTNGSQGEVVGDWLQVNAEYQPLGYSAHHMHEPSPSRERHEGCYTDAVCCML